jgi:hypothetical protein
MAGIRMTRARWRLLVPAVAGVLMALVLLGLSTGSSVADVGNGPLGDLPVDPAWLQAEAQSATNVGQFTNHTVPGAVVARDTNNADCPRTAPNHSQAYYCRQEYIVVWAGKQNAADLD